MKIIVTREDIDSGRRRDPNDCAVARALRRSGVTHSGVTGMLVFLDSNRQRSSVLLPGRVQEWIVDFDWGAPVEPIEFDLVLPHMQEAKPAATSCELPVPAPRKALRLGNAGRFWKRKSCSKPAVTEQADELELVA